MIKSVKTGVRFLLIVIAATLPLALMWTVFEPTDYRWIPNLGRTVLTLLAVPFQIVFATLGIDNIHNIGIPAKTFGVASAELIIIACFRILRSRNEERIEGWTGRLLLLRRRRRTNRRRL